jgi:hypothetical protein
MNCPFEMLAPVNSKTLLLKILENRLDCVILQSWNSLNPGGISYEWEQF